MTILGIAEVVGDASVGYAFPLINGKLVPVELVRGERYDPDSSEPQRYEWRPVLIDYDVWFFHGHAVSVKETTGISEDEMKLRVKHAVFSKLEDFQRVAREVEAFENTGRAADAGRERIPE